MKIKKLENEYKRCLNDDPSFLESIIQNKQHYAELLVYCIDRSIKINNQLLARCVNDVSLVPQIEQLKEKPIYDLCENHFIWVETENGCPFGGMEEGYWVWNNNYETLADFLIYFIRDKLVESLISYGSEPKEIEFESITSLCNKLKNYVVDYKLVEQLQVAVKNLYQKNDYNVFAKNTFLIEKILRSLNIDIRIFAFPSFYEARNLLYAHGYDYVSNEDITEAFYNDELN